MRDILVTKVYWTEKSQLRVKEIGDYIAFDSQQAAIKWVDVILEKEALISANPRIGRVVPEFANQNIRELILKSYRLIYEIKTNKIEVLTIKHCKENIKKNAVD